jgi:dTDP-glucose 4,6-dehydratase
MNAEIEIIADNERMRPSASEVERLFAGVDVAKDLFGWNPEHSGREGFVEGLGKTVDWFREPSNLAAYKTSRYNI